MKRVFVAGLAIALTGAFATASIPTIAAHGPNQAQTMDDSWRSQLLATLSPGDVVFRRGIGERSEAVAVLQGVVRGDITAWTHVGIVVETPSRGGLAIIHAINDRGVVMDSPSTFFASTEASAGTRIAAHKQTQLAATAAKKYLGRPFDDSFELADNSRIYCSELVFLALQDVGARLEIPLRKVPLIASAVAMPDDLFSYLSTSTPHQR